jgi:hypothetical protein
MLERTYMPEPKSKSEKLKLEKLIILNLARSQPQTKRKTSKAISKFYKSTWNAFDKLQEKKLINQAGAIIYNNVEYPTYWLTDEGIVRALMEGANPNVLLELTKALYPSNKTVHCFLEIVSLFDPNVLRIAYSSVNGKGTLGVRELIMLFLSQPSVAMNDETAKKLITALKNYPNERSTLKKALEEMIKQLNQLSQLISE